jgi:hypothetical protein
MLIRNVYSFAEEKVSQNVEEVAQQPSTEMW